MALGTIRAVCVGVVVIALMSSPGTWTLIALVNLTLLYLAAILAVGVGGFVGTALVRSKRRADAAERSDPGP